MQKFKIYKVGGSVRDKLMGIASNDNDYVVVGATVEDMIQLGYKPVGHDFPVFLHPTTHEEYALARTERKTGVGYKGFHFYTDTNITIEEDLSRRDLTINAIAQDSDDHIIDPYGGVADIQNQVIRHVSEAFIEDPLRVIRTARFASRFNFTITSETMLLMKQIVDSGELENLSKERIQMELKKATAQSDIVEFLKILYECKALEHIMGEFKPLVENHQLTDELRYYFKQCDSNLFEGSLNIQEYKFILLHYTVSQHMALEDALLLIKRSLLTNTQSELLSMLIILYPQLVEFDILIKNYDTKHILQLFNIIDPIRKPERFISLENLLLIVNQIKNTTQSINNAIIFINQIKYLFQQIDYKTLLINNNSENIKEIVYNSKLAIINNYINAKK